MAAAFAWAGGAAFVASLVFFVYTYAVTLAVPAAGTGNPVVGALVNGLLFFAFAAHHSLFARAPVKRWLTRLVPAPLERSAYVWVASLLLIAVCVAWQPLPGWVYRHTGLLAGLHLALVACGAALTALAVRLLDPLDLAGISRVSRGRERKGRHNALITGFPYSVVRHPIYLGWALVVFGVPDMTWGRLEMACLSTAYLVLAVPWEERLLVKSFGADYEEYRRRVRWRMLPFVY